MGKNRIIVITILSLILLSVVGVTYAFFISDTKSIGNSNFVVSAEDGQSQFTAFFNESDISFDIKLTEMKENENGYEGKNSNVSLNVTLLSSNDNTVTTCDYDVVYTWKKLNNYNSGNYYYKKSSTLSNENKEFTYEVTGSKVVEETQFPDAGDAKVNIMHETISSANASNISRKQYEIITKFNNIGNISQDEQKDKSFLGSFSVENISCSYRKKLPDAYQEVEWIQFNNKCSINTGVMATYESEFELRFTPTLPSSSGNKYIIETGYSQTSPRYNTGINYSYVVNNYLNNTAGSGAQGGAAPGKYSTRDINTLKVTVDVSASGSGTMVQQLNGVTTSRKVSYPNLLPTVPIKLVDGVAWKCSEFKYKDNNKQIDLVPCYHKSDNIIGMYDIINNVFYKNAESGKFTKGENIN